MMLMMELLQYLGLVSNIRQYWPCPSPYTLAPCECKGSSNRHVELFCHTTDLPIEDLHHSIATTEFPINDFSSMELSYSDSPQSTTKNVFEELTFKHVTIYGNNIKSFDIGLSMFLKSVSSLYRFELHNTNVTDNELHLDNLSEFTSLTSVVFNSNGGIRKVPTIASESLKIRLHLESNSITHFPVNSLAQIPKLEWLYLSKNFLTDSEIKSNRFSNLKNLESISLEKNQLKSLNNETFGYLPRLTMLILDENDIMQIDAGTFRGLPNLETLKLNYNNLISIDSGTFAGLSSLQNLKLRGNKITTLNQDSFADLKYCHVDLSEHFLPILDETWARPLFDYGNSLDFDRGKVGDLKCDCNLVWLFEAGYQEQMLYYSSCVMGNETKILNGMSSTFLKHLKCEDN